MRIAIFGILLIALIAYLEFINKPKNPCILCPQISPIVRIVDGKEITFRCPDAAISLDEKCVLKEGK